jgi:oligopeptide transport system ATP-binding protein
MLRAVDDVSFSLAAGETLGVVGESGCGKSTLGRAVLQLIAPTAGRVLWQGEDLCSLDEDAMNLNRRELQLVFQDPLASLNPRMTVGGILREPLFAFEPGIARSAAEDRSAEMMRRVGLRPEMMNRYPNEFSGGQCQRISIARAMICRPRLVVCDEPVSALDVSIQAQIIALLKELQEEYGVAYIFISHDLSVVRHLCDRIMVLYLGKLMELGTKTELFAAPRHPYTRSLLSAVPIPDPRIARQREQTVLEGDLPSPLNPPSGCVFRTRCPHATPLCLKTSPAAEPTPGADEHRVSCHYWQDIAAGTHRTRTQGGTT